MLVLVGVLLVESLGNLPQKDTVENLSRSHGVGLLTGFVGMTPASVPWAMWSSLRHDFGASKKATALRDHP